MRLEMLQIDLTKISLSPKLWLVNFFLAFLFILFSSVFVLGNFQSHNGDFGQYYIHAQNLLKNRPWGYSLENYPAVLPLYPYLLAIMTFIFGANAFYFSIANSVMWGITCTTWASIYKDKFDTKTSGLLYIFFILFTPFVISFQQEGLPNIMFAMSCSLAIWATLKCKEEGTSSFFLLLILLPALIRIESIAVFSAVITYLLLHKKYLLSLIGVAGIALTIIIDIFIGLNLEMKSNFVVLSDFNQGNIKSSENHFYATIISIFHLASSYVLGFGEMFIPSRLGESSRIFLEFSKTRILSTSYFHFLVLVIFSMGFFKKAKLFDLDVLFLLSLLGLISLFPLPEAPIRYLLPIVPIFAFYFIFALIKATYSVVENRTASVFFGFLVLLPLLYLSLKVAIYEPQRRNFLYNKYTTEMADWVAENRNERGIGFFKPRLMTVLMDLRDQNNAPDYNLRSIEMAEKLIQQRQLVVVFNTGGYGQKDILTHLAKLPAAEVLWKNSSFTVFGSAP